MGAGVWTAGAVVAVVAGVVVGVADHLDNLDLLYLVFLECQIEDHVGIVRYFLHYLDLIF